LAGVVSAGSVVLALYRGLAWLPHCLRALVW
jgi:hypothetical protein